MESLVGRKVSHYRIVERLGEGGMGVVYLARDESLDRDVALKFLPQGLSGDPRWLARFVREAKTLASLSHPNILSIHGIERIGEDSNFLVLERLVGETLAERLARGSLPVTQAILVCEQIALALEAAHERGVFHRDLKPSNVMITAGDIVKVLDFGLAKEMKASQPPESNVGAPLTERGQVMGTLGYMSPEQLRGQDQDARTDIFSFGCVLYECLTGRRSFPGESVGDVMVAILRDEPDWSLLPEALPKEVHELLIRCLEKDRDRRVQAIHEIRTELDTALGASKSGPAGYQLRRPGKRNALPNPATSFVGRERELAECIRKLATARLLTLTGAGGSGKSRLALKVAERLLGDYPDQVWFADLAPLKDGARVPQVVAQVIGLREIPDRSWTQILTDFLANKNVALVLDNCEHVLDASIELAVQLLETCPDVRIIATSRERMSIPGEHVYPVPTLSLPSGADGKTATSAISSDGVRLFVERASLVQPQFEISDTNAAAIAEICVRLDGIPLAIELAAGRLGVLGIEQVRTLLYDRFKLLKAPDGAVPTRHQTLHAVMEWSYDHLGSEEQQLIRTLSVFVGGWTLAAAKAVSEAETDEYGLLDLLTRLVEKSLVVVEMSGNGECRYRLLETVRHFALLKLGEAGSVEAARGRHRDYFLTLAESAEDQLEGPDQGAWMDQLEADHENLLAALSFCDSEGVWGKHLRLAASLWRFWGTRDYCSVGRDHLMRSLEKTDGSVASVERGKALLGAGIIAKAQGDSGIARTLCERAVEVFRAVGDRRHIGRALIGVGVVASGEGRIEEAASNYEQSLAILREAGDRAGTAVALANLGILKERVGDDESCRALWIESLAILKEIGDTVRIALTLNNLGQLALRQGDPVQAGQLLAEGLKLAREVGAKAEVASALEHTTRLAEALGGPRVAACLYGAAEALRDSIGVPTNSTNRLELDQIIARIRSSLGSQRFEAVKAEGRALSYEAAANSAIEWLQHSFVGRAHQTG